MPTFFRYCAVHVGLGFDTKSIDSILNTLHQLQKVTTILTACTCSRPLIFILKEEDLQTDLKAGKG